MAKLTKAQLTSAADELNELMGLDPAINTGKKASAKAIEGKIKEAAEHIEEDDEVSSETIEVLEALGVWNRGDDDDDDDDDNGNGDDDDDDDNGNGDDDDDDDNGNGDDDDDDDDEPAKKPKRSKKPAKGKAKAKVKEEKKKPRGPSAYGTSVDIMCKTPDITWKQLVKKLEKKGIDVESGKSAVRTGFTVVRKIVATLRENGLME